MVYCYLCRAPIATEPRYSDYYDGEPVCSGCINRLVKQQIRFKRKQDKHDEQLRKRVAQERSEG
jgi:hypothetical protein